MDADIYAALRHTYFFELDAVLRLDCSKLKPADRQRMLRDFNNGFTKVTRGDRFHAHTLVAAAYPTIPPIARLRTARGLYMTMWQPSPEASTFEMARTLATLSYGNGSRAAAAVSGPQQSGRWFRYDIELGTSRALEQWAFTKCKENSEYYEPVRKAIMEGQLIELRINEGPNNMMKVNNNG